MPPKRLADLRASWSAIVVGLLLLAPALAHRVLAYEEGGHFYTVHMVVNDAKAPAAGDPNAPAGGLSDQERNVVAFCAQLPDKSDELDAVAVYNTLMLSREYATWLRSSDVVATTNYPLIGRMAVVQQLLHGLTGGSASTVDKVAQQTIQRLLERIRASRPSASSDDFCALGMAYHLLGDSVAHQVLGDSALTYQLGKMYPTGRGHAGDFTMPDHPLAGGERLSRWRTYVDSIAKPLGFAVSVETDQLRDRVAGVPNEHWWGCGSLNGYCEPRLFALLTPAFAPPVENRQPGPCQAYVDRPEMVKALSVRLSCACSWKRFRETTLRVWRTELNIFGDRTQRMQIEPYEKGLFEKQPEGACPV